MQHHGPAATDFLEELMLASALVALVNNLVLLGRGQERELQRLDDLLVHRITPRRGKSPPVEEQDRKVLSANERFVELVLAELEALGWIKKEGSTLSHLHRKGCVRVFRKEDQYLFEVVSGVEAEIDLHSSYARVHLLLGEAKGSLLQASPTLAASLLDSQFDFEQAVELVRNYRDEVLNLLWNALPNFARAVAGVSEKYLN